MTILYYSTRVRVKQENAHAGSPEAGILIDKLDSARESWLLAQAAYRLPRRCRAGFSYGSRQKATP